MPAPAIVSVGTVSVNMTVNPVDIQILPDGSFNLMVVLNFNGASRSRIISVSADGSTFLLDGTPIASPPAALTAFGSALAALTAKLTTFLNVPAIQQALAAA